MILSINEKKRKLLVIADYIGESPNATPYARLKALRANFNIDLCLRKKTQYINNDLGVDIYPYGIIDLVKLARRKEYDFVYVQGIHNYFHAYITAKSINSKLIIDIFDHIGLGKALLKTQKSLSGRVKYIGYQVYYVLGKYTMKKADLVFLTLNKEILNNYPKRKDGYYHLTNGIWKDIANGYIEKINKDDLFRFIYVGYVREDRGIFKILEAVKMLKTISNAFIIDIIGPVNDSELSRINKVIKEYEIEDYVKLHGFLDYEKVKNLLQKADAALYFFPIDRIELKYIYPIKIFEYLAFNLPIVATEGKGIKEISECYKSHILLCKYESESLFRNMKKCIERSEISPVIKIKEEHLWENINQKFVGKIKELYNK